MARRSCQDMGCIQMSDITMRTNDAACDLAPHCYRSARSGTVPNPARQSYANFNIRDDAGVCVSYWGQTSTTNRTEVRHAE